MGRGGGGRRGRARRSGCRSSGPRWACPGASLPCAASGTRSPPHHHHHHHAPCGFETGAARAHCRAGRRPVVRALTWRCAGAAGALPLVALLAAQGGVNRRGRAGLPPRSAEVAYWVRFRRWAAELCFCACDESRRFASCGAYMNIGIKSRCQMWTKYLQFPT